MCELFATFLAEAALGSVLTLWLKSCGLSYNVSKVLAIIIIAVVLSYVLLLFGAVLPKKIARNHPEKMAFALVNIVWMISKLNVPFEIIINVSEKVFSKVFRIKESPKDKLTEKEIRMIIREGMEQGVITNNEKEILFKTLKFNDFLVKDVMVPKSEAYCIKVTEDKNKILEGIKKHKFTRVPVYKSTKDNIVGILNIKDIIIDYASNNDMSWNLEDMLREPLYTHENQKIAELFKSMQVNSQLIAVVVNDNKEVKGIITLEDIIEKIVGQITDEYDGSK